jgi:hypothetical protein
MLMNQRNENTIYGSWLNEIIIFSRSQFVGMETAAEERRR